MFSSFGAKVIKNERKAKYLSLFLFSFTTFVLYHRNIWLFNILSLSLRDDSKESPSRVGTPRRETKAFLFYPNSLAICILSDSRSTRGVQ